MSCFVCGRDGDPVVLPDCAEYLCPECGRYRICNAAMEKFTLHSRKFDVYVVRRWIADQLDSGTIPLIDENMVLRLMQT